MPFQDQVICIYAGTRGFLDKLPISDIGPYQVKLLEYFKANGASVLADIESKGALSPELDKTINDMMAKFTADFTAA